MLDPRSRHWITPPKTKRLSYNQMLWMSIADMEAAYPPE